MEIYAGEVEILEVSERAQELRDTTRGSTEVIVA